jgi:hypothetical protein
LATNRKFRRRERRLDLVELDKDCRFELEHGRPLIVGFGGNLEAFKAAWELHGPEILEEFIRDHPGKRPFACWLLVHKKERPVVDNSWPTTGEGKAVMRQEHTHYGFFHTDYHPPIQEAEANYLARHGLLTDEERRILGRPRTT